MRRMRSREVACVDDALDRPDTPYSDQPDTRHILQSDSQQWTAQRYAEPMEPALPPPPASNVEFQGVDPWSGVSTQHDAPPAKKKRLSLPWWCCIIAWIVLWVTVGVCVTFVTFYGIMFQDDKCKKWITSMVVSFVTSVLFTQPIKVLLLALFFALIFKKTDDDEEEAELEDEEDPDLGPDEAWLHSSTLAGNSLLIIAFIWNQPKMAPLSFCACGYNFVRQFTTITEDTRETTFLFERLSVAPQRGNSVSFHNTMVR